MKFDLVKELEKHTSNIVKAKNRKEIDEEKDRFNKKLLDFYGIK